VLAGVGPSWNAVTDATDCSDVTCSNFGVLGGPPDTPPLNDSSRPAHNISSLMANVTWEIYTVLSLNSFVHYQLSPATFPKKAFIK
jgi:hypothetical protein